MQTLEDPKVVLFSLFRACHSSEFLVNSDAAVVVDNELLACCVQSDIVKDLILLHGIQCLDHPSCKYHVNLSSDHVQNLTWASVRLFLESDRAALYLLREGRSSKAWLRHLIRVSLEVSKLFMLPCGKTICPLKFDHLKRSVEGIVGDFCRGLKASFSEEGYSLFFSSAIE